MASSRKYWAGAGILLTVLCFSLVFSLFGCGDLENGNVASLTVSPASITVGVNRSAAFSSLAKDSAGKIVSASVTWSVIGGLGTISQTGLFTAGGNEGTCTIVATTDSVSAQAGVAITAKGWIVGRVSASDGANPSGLKVYLFDLPTYVDFTDTSGDYSISGVPAGQHTVYTLETSIYYPGSQEVTVASGETVTQDIFVNIKPGTPTIPTIPVPTFI